ncbi:MAG: hypothetical protein U0414_32105 [Polyangiaceae bacterium]
MLPPLAGCDLVLGLDTTATGDTSSGASMSTSSSGAGPCTPGDYGTGPLPGTGYFTFKVAP